MQIIRLLSILLAFILMQACASYTSKQQARAINMPELGSIIQTQGSFWYATAEQVGAPHWRTPLEVQVLQLPFNKASYGTYSTYMAKASRINGIAYVDSLPYKPKYLRLQLQNKMGISVQLNEKTNANVLAYLENDTSYKLVTSLDITLPDAMLSQLLASQQVALHNDPEKGSYLLLMNGNQETELFFSEIQPFNYGYSTFCWGEDRYHNKRVENLLSGNKACPKGTHKKAAKVSSNKSYLKF